MPNIWLNSIQYHVSLLNIELYQKRTGMCGNDVSTIVEPEQGFLSLIESQVASGKVSLSTSTILSRQAKAYHEWCGLVQKTTNCSNQRTRTHKLWPQSRNAGRTPQSRSHKLDPPLTKYHFAPCRQQQDRANRMPNDRIRLNLNQPKIARVKWKQDKGCGH